MPKNIIKIKIYSIVVFNKIATPKLDTFQECLRLIWLLVAVRRTDWRAHDFFSATASRISLQVSHAIYLLTIGILS